MSQPTTDDELFSRVCDGLASKEEVRGLHRMLRTDAAKLDAWLLYSSLHVTLATGAADREAGLRLLPAPPVPNAAPTPPQRAWSHWMPLTSAVAGVLVGLFAATMLWAYVAPSDGRRIVLLDDGFESASSPLVTRVPLTPGVWRGDYAEIVSEENGIKPATGQKMLRLLRAGYDGKSKSPGGHIADVYRLIDVRSFRQEFADGGAVVQASASVNAAPFSTEEKYGCAISIYALDAEAVPDSASHVGTALTSEANAMARSDRTMLDHDPSNWQRLTTELRLPPSTEFLVVRLHINQLFDPHDRTIFTGSYADDVRVTLTRRRPLP